MGAQHSRPANGSEMASIIDMRPNDAPKDRTRWGERLPQLLANRRGHVAALALFYLLLSVEYYRFVYGCFSLRMGFQFGYTPVTLLVGFFLMVLLGLVLYFMPERDDNRYAVSMIVGLLGCIPQTILYQIGQASIFGSLYALLFVVLLSIPSLRIPPFRLSRLSEGRRLWLVVLLCVAALLPFVLNYGLPRDLSVLSMDEHIYDVRQAYRSQGSLLTAYLQGPLCKVLLPMLIVLGMSKMRERWWLLLLGLAGMVYLFLTNPEKSIFFSIAVVLLCYPFAKGESKAGVLLYGLLGASLLAVLLQLLMGQVMPESVLVRRLFFIPALVTDAYFAFFDQAPLMLSHSVLGSLFEYPYSVEPSHLIGQMMYARDTINCNAGIFADGFMNFGHIGAILFVGAAAFVVQLFEAAEYDGRYFGLVALFVFTLLNSALFTTLLTHGGWCLLLVMLFVVPRREAAA